VGPAGGAYNEHYDAGMPNLSGGVLQAEIPLDDARDNYISISAYDAMGSSSAFSTDTLVLAALVEPEPAPEPEPQPEPEPEPDDTADIDPAITDRAILAALGLGASVGFEDQIDGLPSVFRESRYGDAIAKHLAYGAEYVVCDLRGDGLLDLVVGNLYSDPSAVRRRRAPGRILIYDLRSAFDGKGRNKISRYRERATFMDELNRHVETHVSCGDLDGDGMQELIVSSGEGGGNRIQILDDLKHGFNEFPLPESSRGIMAIARDILAAGGDGEMFTATGDFDGDGLDEVSVTFKRPLADQVLILDDAVRDLSAMTTIDLDAGYLTTTDESRSMFEGKVAPVTIDIDDDGMDEVMVIYVDGGEISFDIFDDATTGFSMID
jgi:hypothetical protein